MFYPAIPNTLQMGEKCIPCYAILKTGPGYSRSCLAVKELFHGASGQNGFYMIDLLLGSLRGRYIIALLSCNLIELLLGHLTLVTHLFQALFQFFVHRHF